MRHIKKGSSNGAQKLAEGTAGLMGNRSSSNRADKGAQAVAASSSEYDDVLSIAAVYEDPLTQEWALQKCRRAMHLVGKDYVRVTWWQMQRLNEPRLLLDAVREAALADIILVSVQAAEEVPSLLGGWFDRLLERRARAAGSLVALLGIPERPQTQPFPLVHYLRAVAEKGNLEFVVEEFPVLSDAVSRASKPIAERAYTITQVLNDILDPAHYVHPVSQPVGPRPAITSATQPLVEADRPAKTPKPPAGRSAGKKVRILLVDDHEIVREGLRDALQRQGDMEVVGEAADGRAAVELARALEPDVVIMDVSMPGMNGIEATRVITREHPAVRVIALSMHEEAEAMRKAGAEAFVPKSGPLRELIVSLRHRTHTQTGPAGA